MGGALHQSRVGTAQSRIDWQQSGAARSTGNGPGGAEEETGAGTAAEPSRTEPSLTAAIPGTVSILSRP